MGVAVVWATCRNPNCLHSTPIAFDAIGLGPQTPFPEIEWFRRLICSACGMRGVSITPDWRPNAPQCLAVISSGTFIFGKPPEHRCAWLERLYLSRQPAGHHPPTVTVLSALSIAARGQRCVGKALRTRPLLPARAFRANGLFAILLIDDTRKGSEETLCRFCSGWIEKSTSKPPQGVESGRR